MDILLLGGYRFLGRALIEAAQEAGHAVTAFNRGNSPAPDGVEHVTGDRDDLWPLAGRRWDAAIDTSGYIPRHARVAGDALHAAVGRYAFVSSVSVYQLPFPPNTDESGPLATMTPGADPDGPVDENYGARKVLCERELEERLPGRVLAVRAGFIVGPHDYTDRFNSWVERAARKRPMIVGGDLDAPLQLIDVRDIAHWIVHAIERGVHGPRNVTGPERPLTARAVAQACLDGTGSSAPIVNVPSAELEAAGVDPRAHLPFWFDSSIYPLMEVNVDRARAEGLRFRPLTETVVDTAEWLRESRHERRIDFPVEIERALLATPRS